jgi:hypothetical protein
MKKTSLEDWKEIAAQSKMVRKELFRLMNQTSDKLPIPLTKQIVKTISQLDNFRNLAEERMMSTGVSDDIHIFYGNNE